MRIEMIGPKPLLVRGRCKVRPHVFPMNQSVPILPEGLCFPIQVSGGQASKTTGYLAVFGQTTNNGNFLSSAISHTCLPGKVFGRKALFFLQQKDSCFPSGRHSTLSSSRMKQRWGEAVCQVRGNRSIKMLSIFFFPSFLNTLKKNQNKTKTLVAWCFRKNIIDTCLSAFTPLALASHRVDEKKVTGIEVPARGR